MPADLTVFAHAPALRLVWDLNDRGVDLRVTDDGQQLQVTPADAVTADDVVQLRDLKLPVLAIVGCCDDGVWHRVHAFRQQPGTEQPVLIPGVQAVLTRCRSCLAKVSRPGRCWRCRLAYRLARQRPIHEEVMTPTPELPPVPDLSHIPDVEVQGPVYVHEPEPVPEHEPDPDSVPVPDPVTKLIPFPIR